MSIPTPAEYERLYWHARALAAEALRKEIQTLRAAVRGGRRHGYDPARVIDLAHRLHEAITPDPPHVIAQRRRDALRDTDFTTRDTDTRGDHA